MFTGLVQAVGRVTSLEPTPTGARLTITRLGWENPAQPGDSIAVNGCCLTYAPYPGDGPHDLGFDLVPQTLQLTTLGGLKAGGRVNLEPSLTPSSAMGGHFVQGHVDGTGLVTRIEKSGGQHRVTLQLDVSLIRYIIPQGSVAVDGVSLTVAGLDLAACSFEVALIPTTLEHTTLADLIPGAHVNIEADMLVKAVVHTLKTWGGRG